MVCVEGIGSVGAPMSGKDDELHLACACSTAAQDGSLKTACLKKKEI
jgi:hypothetical protein